MNEKNEIEEFREWTLIKARIHAHGSVPWINEGEVWWTAVGKNVGVEINGKSAVFSRPVLIYKKLNRNSFLGIPLTTQFHDGDWYVPFEFQGKTSRAVLSQMRTMSTLRLYRRMGRVTDTDMAIIKRGLDRLYK